MSIEELQKLENFDLETYNRDPNYRKMVDDARKIKANADQVLRDQENKIPQETPREKPVLPNYDIHKDPNFSKVIDENPIPQRPQTTDFTFQDFINQQKYDNNSPINKNLRNEKGALVNSMWADRSLLKKYWASKKTIKIKIVNEDRYNTYTFRSVNDEQLTQLQQMAEDIGNFYALIHFEKREYEDMDGVRIPALFRNGRYYYKISEIQNDFRKAVAFICLGIPEEEFSTLEQFSDPDYTIKDIWGIYDLIDGIYERAAKGGSYFLIASKL